MSGHNKWRCTECQCIFGDDALLKAANPFDPESQVTGCPECKSIDSFNAACAIDGCTDWGTCGMPHSDGVYRYTCSKHADWVHLRAI